MAVSDYRPRSDGYYWPQCLVDPDDLVRRMESYAAEPDRIGELKRAARAHAESSLDWNRNAAGLDELLAATTILAGEPRRRAREAALAFERQRLDPRFFFPRLSRLLARAGTILRPLAGRYGGRR